MEKGNLTTPPAARSFSKKHLLHQADADITRPDDNKLVSFTSYLK